MLETLYRLLLLMLFAFLSFGIGPALFPMSSFIPFLLVYIFTQIHKNDLRQYIWLIIFGIIADAMIGVAFGVHVISFVLCALLSYISLHKISLQRVSSRASLIFSAIVVTMIATLLYEITIGNNQPMAISWNILISIAVSTAILYLPLMGALQFLERVFGEFQQAQNYKKHH